MRAEDASPAATLDRSALAIDAISCPRRAVYCMGDGSAAACDPTIGGPPNRLLVVPPLSKARLKLPLGGERLHLPSASRTRWDLLARVRGGVSGERRFEAPSRRAAVPNPPQIHAPRMMAACALAARVWCGNLNVAKSTVRSPQPAARSYTCPAGQNVTVRQH
jgi:hypothetical protein